MSENNYITIKKGNEYVNKVEKDLLISIKPTSDGISFIFKNGFETRLIDERMPTYTKNILENSLNTIFKTKAEIIFDLNNYNKPLQMVLI